MTASYFWCSGSVRFSSLCRSRRRTSRSARAAAGRARVVRGPLLLSVAESQLALAALASLCGANGGRCSGGAVGGNLEQTRARS